jgi:Sec7-like guanine-nucleotide exchange factor
MCAAQSMVGKSPEDIAKFLAKTSGLEKTVIGEYLGEREDTALAVMHAYVDAMDFVNLEFDNAIRCRSFPRNACKCNSRLKGFLHRA